MITKEQLEKLEDFLHPEETERPGDNEIWDVIVEGKEKTALLCDGQWYLTPVNFKFGNETHRGQPYWSMTQEEIIIVTEEYLKSLPTWSYDWRTGIFAIWNIPQ